MTEPVLEARPMRTRWESARGRGRWGARYYEMAYEQSLITNMINNGITLIPPRLVFAFAPSKEVDYAPQRYSIVWRGLCSDTIRRAYRGRTR